MDSSHFWYGIPTHKNWTFIIEKTRKARWYLYNRNGLKEIIKEEYKRTYEKENRHPIFHIREKSNILLINKTSVYFHF